MIVLPAPSIHPRPLAISARLSILPAPTAAKNPFCIQGKLTAARFNWRIAPVRPAGLGARGRRRDGQARCVGE